MIGLKLNPWAVLASAFALSAGMFAQDAHWRPDGTLEFPADYREWIFLSSGLGMTYGPAAPNAMESPRFDTVFVNPPAWKKFKETGHWPEGTFFILEIRYSTSHGSINRGGFYQTDVAAIEAHVKDARYPGGWGFFGFGGGLAPVRTASAEMGKDAGGCRTCHTTNGAVETTFVQFYPSALAIANEKHTVEASFKAPTPSPAGLLDMMRTGGWAKTQEVLEHAKAAQEPVPETNLNQIGYTLLQSKDTATAVKLFRWTAEQFPASVNAQDSYSEACEAAGDKACAVAAARRAVALAPADSRIAKSAGERLKRLGE